VSLGHVDQHVTVQILGPSMKTVGIISKLLLLEEQPEKGRGKGMVGRGIGSQGRAREGRREE
jgi:hypothetical protein